MLDETKLFDFIKIMFTKHDQYAMLKKINKQRHRFMVNRLFAIKYPTAANLLNRNGIPPFTVADSWFRVASQFKQVPNWIWVKTKKTENENIKNTWQPKEETIEFFIQKNEIGIREYKDLIKFKPKEVLDYLKDLEEKMQMYK